MARVFKDHFGNATSQFDRINKFDKSRKEKRLEDYSLADQIRMVAEIEEKERKEKAAAEKAKANKKEEISFSDKELYGKKEVKDEESTEEESDEVTE